MATYNMASYLPVAIESVLAQDFANFELLIGDNLSTDQTAEIAREYANRDPRIKYHLNEQHCTAAENFNACYERSNPGSRYWIMLASDDWWKPNLLRSLVAIADEDPELAFVHCDARITDENGQPRDIRYSDLWNYMTIPPHGPHYGAAELFHGCYVMALATLVNRDVNDRIYPRRPMMDPSLRLTPDHNMWLQLMVRGAKAFYVDETLAFYRKHNDAMTMSWNDHARLYEEVTIFSDKLNGVCPPELEPIRLDALRSRYAQLGFNYLAAEQPDRARGFLSHAHSIGGSRRLDIPCARVVSALPIPAHYRAGLWNQAVRANTAFGRSR
jgi:glycosyltransferase involved in cell wall biosynthesis